MRNAFMKAIIELAQRDPRVFFITGDLGFGMIEPFVQKYPAQFLNVGVAEQNMVGIAAGLALSGRTVFVYSISNFPTLRCLEQIRNDLCYHRVNVKIVAGGGGFVYGALGSTHHATEDLAVMRALPNMTVIAPGDPVEADLAVRAAVTRPGPCYIRLSRANDPVVHTSSPSFHIGRAITVREGNDLTLITTGGMLPVGVEVVGKLWQNGKAARLLSMHTIKPLDVQAVKEAAHSTRAVVTLEEHTVIGGLGSAVAEVLAELPGPKPIFKRIGVQDTFSKQIGSQAFLRRQHGLSVESIVREIETLLASNPVD